MSGVTTSGNAIVGFENPIYSTQAWSNYLAGGIATKNLISATGAGNNIKGASTGTTTLYGGGTVESMFGTANETVFVGGGGTQYMYGGSGKAIFTYLSIADSTPQSKDVISNFDPTKDVIDLSRIDADLSQSGVQNLTFVGTAAFSAAGGQVLYQQDAATNTTYVEADLFSDSTPDLYIKINGMLNLTAANFALTAAQSAAATAPAAEVTSLTDSAPSADLQSGKVVTLTLNFSHAVNVTGGTPTLTLNDGGKAVYKGGSGSNALVFTYTVAAGQNTSKLAVTAISPGGATIRDNNGENAILGGAVASLPHTLEIDTTPAKVTSVTATAASHDLDAGKTAKFTVNFSEAVNIANGKPTLTLNDGGTATYATGSGSNALIFNYTVKAGQNTPDLSVKGLSLNGATIADAAENAANVTSAAINPAGILKIDTTTPTVVSARATPGSGHEITTGQLATITLTTSEAVTVAGTPVLLLNNGTTATYDAALSTSNAAVFSYAAGNETTTGLAVVGAELSSGSSIADLAGNSAILGDADSNLGLMVNTTKWAPDPSSVGNFTLAGSSDIEMFGASKAKFTFASGATGTLTLEHSQSFAGTVAGLAQGNYLDLGDIAYMAGNSPSYAPNSSATGGELTVTDGSHTASIALLGQYLAANFTTSSDGHGGTLITDPPLSHLVNTLLGISHC